MSREKKAFNQWLMRQQINSYGKRNDDPAMEHEQLAVLYKYELKDKYELDHCYLLGGSEDLRIVFSCLNEHLSDHGKSCYIAVRPYTHLVVLHLLNNNGHMHAYLADPQGWGKHYEPNINIALAIKEYFSNSTIYTSSYQIQSQADNRNCSMFGFEILKHFIDNKDSWFTASDHLTDCAKEQWNGVEVYCSDENIFLPGSHLAGNQDEASTYRQKLRDQVLFDTMAAANLFDSSYEEIDQQAISSIVDEMNGVPLLAKRNREQPYCHFDVKTGDDETYITFTPPSNSQWQHLNFPRYMHGGIFPGHVAEGTTRIFLDGFTFSPQGKQVHFNAKLHDNGTIVYHVNTANIDVIKKGVKAYILSENFPTAANNMRQPMARLLFMENMVASLEKNHIQVNNKGGFFAEDIATMLKYRLEDRKDVTVVNPDWDVQQEDLISVAIAGAEKDNKRFLVFPYSQSEHVIGVVIDRNKKEMRIYDHQSATSNNSMQDHVLQTIAIQNGYQKINGFPLTPYAPQENDWECGILALLAITHDIEHSEDMVPYGDKRQPDLDKEATRICNALYGTIPIYDVLAECWGEKLPIPLWVKNRFDLLDPAILSRESLAGLSQYVTNMQKLSLTYEGEQLPFEVGQSFIALEHSGLQSTDEDDFQDYKDFFKENYNIEAKDTDLLMEIYLFGAKNNTNAKEKQLASEHEKYKEYCDAKEKMKQTRLEQIDIICGLLPEYKEVFGRNNMDDNYKVELFRDQFGNVPVFELKNYDESKQRALIGRNALICYDKNFYNESYFSFDDIRELDSRQIEVLTSEEAMECYAIPGFPTTELMQLDGFMTCDADQIKALMFLNAPNLRDPEVLHSIKDKMVALTSWRARKCYREGYFSLRELGQYDANKVKALISESAMECYVIEGFPIKELMACDANQIEALTSSHARKFSVEEIRLLKEYSARKIDALTSNDARECYRKGYFSLRNLAQYDRNKIRALTLDDATECYAIEDFPIEELTHYDSAKIELLTSKDIRYVYRKKGFPTKEFMACDANQIKVLTSLDARNFSDEEIRSLIDKMPALASEGASECYSKGYISLRELAQYDVKKIKALTSEDAIDCYETSQGIYPKIPFPIKELMHYEGAKIELLTSRDIRYVYRREGFPTKEFMACDVNQINALMSSNALDFSVGEIRSLIKHPADKIRALASEGARECYRKGRFSLRDLGQYEEKKIKALTSSDARNFSGEEIRSLIKHPADKIRALASEGVRECYRKGHFSLRDLEQYDAKKIKALTSSDARNFSGEEIRSLTEHPADKIRALASEGARECYRKGHFSLRDLEQYDTNKIKALTSEDAIKCYVIDGFPLKEFMACDVNEIKALTSSDARNFSGKEVRSLTEYSADKIRALTSEGARECYRKDHFSLRELEQYDAKKVKALTSEDAKKCYAIERFPREELMQYDSAKIKLLTSKNIKKAYRKNGFPIKEVMACDVDRINALTSSNVLNFSGQEIRSLIKHSADKTRALTSEGARECYRKGHLSLTKLAQYDVNKIKALTSEDAKKCYAIERFPREELMKYDSAKIELLTSKDMRDACRKTDFPIKKVMACNNLEKINELISKSNGKHMRASARPAGEALALTSKPALRKAPEKGGGTRVR